MRHFPLKYLAHLIIPMTARYTLEQLEVVGDHMRYIPMREMGIMRSLRRVGLASTRDYGNLRLSQVIPASHWSILIT